MDPDNSSDDDYEYNEGAGEDVKPGQKKHRKPGKPRRLQRWNPDVDQFLLLVADQECSRLGIPIPWDKIGPKIEPWLSGEAIKQHLAKVIKNRASEGRRVPEKFEKGARCKMATLPPDPCTPARSTGKKAKTVKIEKDDDAADTPSKGSDLLWHPPPKNKAIKKEGGDEDQTPKTPSASAGGRKKSKINTNENAVVDSIETKSTGKRSRKPKKSVVDVDDADDDASFGSPAKKQKVGSLRAVKKIDYNEHLSDDDMFYDVKQEAQDDEMYEQPESEFAAPTKVDWGAMPLAPVGSKGLMREEWAHRSNGPSKKADGKRKENAAFAHPVYDHAHSNTTVTGYSSGIANPFPNTPSKPKITPSRKTGTFSPSSVTLSPEKTPKKHGAHKDVPAAKHEEEDMDFSAYGGHGHGGLIPEPNMMGFFHYPAPNPAFHDMPNTIGGPPFHNGLVMYDSHFPANYNTQRMMAAEMSAMDYSSSNSSSISDLISYNVTEADLTAANSIAPTPPTMPMITAPVNFAANHFNSHNNHHNGIDNHHDGSAIESYSYNDTAGAADAMAPTNHLTFDSFSSQLGLHGTQSSTMSSATGSPTAEASGAFALSKNNSFESSSDELAEKSEGMKIYDNEKPWDPVLYHQEHPDDALADLGEYEHDGDVAMELLSRWDSV